MDNNQGTDAKDCAATCATSSGEPCAGSNPGCRCAPSATRTRRVGPRATTGSCWPNDVATNEELTHIGVEYAGGIYDVLTWQDFMDLDDSTVEHIVRMRWLTSREATQRGYVVEAFVQ